MFGNRFIGDNKNEPITVGVNCSIEFNKLFMGFVDHVAPRDIIQGSMRFRKFKEDVIELYWYQNAMNDIFKGPQHIKPQLNYYEQKQKELIEFNNYVNT